MNADAAVYASAEVYYSIGAVLSGFLVYRFFSSFSEYLSIIILMSLVCISFFGMSFSNNIFLFFATHLLLGISNAGVRIIRTTFLFSNIPNNLIGRAGSVFSSINVLVRMLLIIIFTLPFFLREDNIRWGYFVGAILVMTTIFSLTYYYLKEKKNLN